MSYVIRSVVIAKHSMILNASLNHNQQQLIATNNDLCLHCLLQLINKPISDSKLSVSSDIKSCKQTICKNFNGCNGQIIREKSIKPTSSNHYTSSPSTIATNRRVRQMRGVRNIITPQKQDDLHKILVIGELRTGKTSFIRRYVDNFYSKNYRATIGVEFAMKVLNWNQNSTIRLQFWDIAGQERFGNMTRAYYKEAAGAFILFDVTRTATFDAVIKWKRDLDSKVQLPDGSPIPCILIANKCDQLKQGMASIAIKLDEYVEENGFAGWYETSAKDNINIEEAATELVNEILLNNQYVNTDVDIDNLIERWQ